MGTMLITTPFFLNIIRLKEKEEKYCKEMLLPEDRFMERIFLFLNSTCPTK